MTNYIDPFQSDEQTIREHGVLSRRRSREDYLAAQAEGGIDAAIANSKKPEKAYVMDGFRKIPGASRSGALDPQTRARLESDERAGLIEVQRNVYGEPIAFRPVSDG